MSKVSLELSAEQSLSTLDINNNIVSEFYEKNERLKKLKKEVDSLKSQIKNEMVNKSVKKAELGKLVTISYQDRSKLDEEKVVALLKSKGLEEGIMIEEKPHPEKLKEYMKTGQITLQEIADRTIKNLIPVLKVKENK